MATYLPHVKVSFGGTLGVPPVEEWSNTVRFKIWREGMGIEQDDPTDSSAILTSGDLDAALEVVAAPLQAWIQRPTSLISSTARLSWVKVHMIGDNGRHMDTLSHRLDFGGYGGPIGSPQPHWYQTVALTLRTELSRGRSHSGRIFPPMVAAVPEGSTPYISFAQAGGMAASFATCLDEISSALNGLLVMNSHAYPVVASPATNTGPNPGGALLQRITGVVTDRVADVQHRRTRQVARSEGERAAVAGA